MVSPRPTRWKPLSRAASSSASVQPPSGPIRHNAGDPASADFSGPPPRSANTIFVAAGTFRTIFELCRLFDNGQIVALRLLGRFDHNARPSIRVGGRTPHSSDAAITGINRVTPTSTAFSKASSNAEGLIRLIARMTSGPPFQPAASPQCERLFPSGRRQRPALSKLLRVRRELPRSPLRRRGRLSGDGVRSPVDTEAVAFGLGMREVRQT